MSSNIELTPYPASLPDVELAQAQDRPLPRVTESALFDGIHAEGDDKADDGGVEVDSSEVVLLPVKAGLCCVCAFVLLSVVTSFAVGAVNTLRIGMIYERWTFTATKCQLDWSPLFTANGLTISLAAINANRTALVPPADQTATFMGQVNGSKPFWDGATEKFVQLANTTVTSPSYQTVTSPAARAALLGLPVSQATIAGFAAIGWAKLPGPVGAAHAEKLVDNLVP